MILNVVKAEYISDYKVSLTFNDGIEKSVDLKNTVLNDHRKIFEPLRDINYFKKFHLSFNTISWDNEADFAPEFLYDL